MFITLFFLSFSLTIIHIIYQYFMIYSPQGGLDGGDKDDLDSGDENEGRKIDTEEVVIQNGYIRQVL